jgi:hypothetical protein
MNTENNLKSVQDIIKDINTKEQNKTKDYKKSRSIYITSI